MVNAGLLYAGSIIITLWGIAHIIPTKSIVNGFGEISTDNRLIITMDWIAEGLTLCFIGLLVFFTTMFAGSSNCAAKIVYMGCTIMLIGLTILSLFTGAKTSVVPMKICPIIKTTVAVLFFLGLVL